MKVVVDLDDTLADFTRPVVQMIKDRFSKDIDITSLDQKWLSSNLTPDQWETLKPMIYTVEFYLSLRLLHDWRRLNAFLTEIDVLHYVTARKAPLGDNAETITRRWLSHHSLPMGASVIITHHADDKVKSFPARTDVVVEDNAHVIASAEEAGIPVIVIDHPWNRHVELRNPGSSRIAHIGQASKALLRARDNREPRW